MSTDVKKSSGDELNRTASTTNLNTSLDEGTASAKPKDSVSFIFTENEVTFFFSEIYILVDFV